MQQCSRHGKRHNRYPRPREKLSLPLFFHLRDACGHDGQSADLHLLRVGNKSPPPPKRTEAVRRLTIGLIANDAWWR